MNTRLIITLIVAAIFLTLASLWMGQQAYFWFPPQASAESVLIDDLFSFLVALGTFIFLGVTGTLGYSILFHRAGRYDYSDGPPIEGNITLEVVWTAIPIVLVIWIAGYSYQVYQQMAIRGPMEVVHLHMPTAMEAAYAEPVAGAPTEAIDVEAKQWAWVFRYPAAAAHSEVTSTELHLPVDQRIHLELTSEDVLHGFYVPAFRLKQDIIPGKTIDFEFTPTRIGKYRLRDSQYSGTYFAAMQADVVVESAADYQQWLADAATQTPTPAYNRAAFEYNRAAEQSVVRGWQSIPPAPPPVVNYSPKQSPKSPPA
jgi:cytochrome c oxidase subunit II